MVFTEGIKIEKENEEQDMEIIVTDIIHQIGVPAHIKGYHYLREAILLSIYDTEMLESVTKVLYPTVAKKFSTTSSPGNGFCSFPKIKREMGPTTRKLSGKAMITFVNQARP